MGNTVNPSTERTASVEAGKTAPKSNVDFLEKVAARFCVDFVGTSEPLECRAVAFSSLPIEIILTGRISRHGRVSSHI